MRVSTRYGITMYVWRTVAFAVILLIVNACSPYLYQKEVTLFNEGVNNSVASFEELKQKERDRRIQRRNENLKKDSLPINLTAGCDELRIKYEKGFSEAAMNVLTEADYKDCQVIPTGEPTIDPLIPNLTAIGGGLKAYAEALKAVSRAEDVNELQNSFTEFNISVKELLKTVNHELSKKGEEKFDAIAELVYRAGVTYLNQRRFKALKKAVNETHHVIKKAAELLAEGAFDMQGPELSEQSKKLLDLNIKAANRTGDDYVTAWLLLNDERDTYVGLFKNSPVGIFQKLTKTHEALRQSVNDPRNKKQIEQVLTNAKTFHDSAKTALKLFKKNG